MQIRDLFLIIFFLFLFSFYLLQLNVTLLAVSVLNYGLPIYMIYLAKKLRRQQKTEQEPDEQRLIKSPTSKSALETVPEQVWRNSGRTVRELSRGLAWGWTLVGQSENCPVA